MAAQTLVHELDTMRLIFDYAVRLGLMLSNPAKDIKRRKIVSQPIVIPTREQFQKLVAAIRESDERLDSQKKAKAGVDLVELLAYSGCRIHEGISLKWADVDFDKNTVKVTGGERGAKNHEERTSWPVCSSLTTRSVSGCRGKKLFCFLCSFLLAPEVGTQFQFCFANTSKTAGLRARKTM